MSKAIMVKAGETIFFAETDESIEVPSIESLPGVPKGMQPTVGAEKITQEFKTVKNLIIACCDEVLNAINSTTPKPERVAVEFGIKFAGEGGFPMLAKASGEANFKISIDWKKSES
jgi:hypothetical protein